MVYWRKHMPLFTSASAKNANASRKLLLVSAICLLVIALSSIVIQSVPTKKIKRTFSSGETKNAMQDLFMRMPLLALNGKVLAVNSDSITVDVSGILGPSANDGTQRTIAVDSKTKFFSVSMRTPSEMHGENEIFAKSLKEAAGDIKAKPPTPPSPFTRTPATIDDVKVGSFITITPTKEVPTEKDQVVTASAPDLRTIKTFTAGQVLINIPVHE